MVRYNVQRKTLETSIKPWELLKSLRPSGSLEGKYKEIKCRSRALRSTVHWSRHLTPRNEMVNSKICCGVHIGLSTVKCVWFLYLTTERDLFRLHIWKESHAEWQSRKSGKDVSLGIPKSPTRRETCHKMLANHKMSLMKKCFTFFFYFAEEKSKKIFNCGAVEPL